MALEPEADKHHISFKAQALRISIWHGSKPEVLTALVLSLAGSNRIFDLYLSSEIPFKYYGACLLCYAKLEVSLYIVWFRRPMKH